MAEDKVILEIKVEDNRPGESGVTPYEQLGPNAKQQHRINQLQQQAKGLGVDTERPGGYTGGEYEMRLERLIAKARTGVDANQERILANNRRRAELNERRERIQREARASAGNALPPVAASPDDAPQISGDAESPASRAIPSNRSLVPYERPTATRSAPYGGQLPPPGASGGSSGGGGGGLLPPPGAAGGAEDIPYAEIASGGRAAGNVLPALATVFFATELLKDAVTGLTATFNALNEEAEKAAQFNARVAAAQGIGQAREIIGNINRAERISSELTEFTIQRDALLEELRDLKTSVVGVVAPTITDAMTVITAILQVINTIAESPLFTVLLKDFSVIGLYLQQAGLSPAFIKLVMAALKKFTREQTIPQGELLQEIERFLDPVPITRAANRQHAEIERARAI